VQVSKALEAVHDGFTKNTARKYVHEFLNHFGF